MIEVARELVHIAKESIDGNGSKRGPALEETFSNSGLLQMISMSPASIYVPRILLLLIIRMMYINYVQMQIYASLL